MSAEPGRIVLADRLLYLLTHSGLHIFDRSDALHPVERGAFPFAFTTGGVLVAQAGLAYVLQDGQPASSSDLVIFDLSHPTDPKPISRLHVPQVHSDADITLVGSTLLAPFRGPDQYDAGAGVTLVDVSDPSHPVQAGSVITNDFVWAVAGQGTTAYLVTQAQQGAVRVLDVSDPLQPTLIGAFGSDTWSGSQSTATTSTSLAEARRQTMRCCASSTSVI